MKTFIIYYRFTKPGEKKPGPVQHYKLMAGDRDEAEQLMRRYANYPGIEVLEVREV